MYEDMGRPESQCPYCRAPFDSHIRIFLTDHTDESPQVLEPALPLREDQMERVEEVEQASKSLGVESRNRELEAVVGRAETLMLDLITTHGNSDAKVPNRIFLVTCNTRLTW